MDPSNRNQVTLEQLIDVIIEAETYLSKQVASHQIALNELEMELRNIQLEISKAKQEESLGRGLTKGDSYFLIGVLHAVNLDSKSLGLGLKRFSVLIKLGGQKAKTPEAVLEGGKAEWNFQKKM